MKSHNANFPRLLHRTAHAWRLAIDNRLKEAGLSRASWVAVSAIADAEQTQPWTQKQLAAYLGLETASLVPLIHRLEQQNLIRRQTLAADKRQKLLLTTSQGKALYRQVKIEADALRNELLSYVSEPDLDTTRRVLDTLLRAAEAKQR